MDHQRPHVLIVDDQLSLRRTMTGIIEDWGCRVADAEDGYQAIESVKNTLFDLVFLDIKMPGINGIQTFREIKKMRPDSLVVMMTGCDAKESIAAAVVDEGAMCVVFKPFEPDHIIHILRSAHESCPANLPNYIGATVGKVQNRINGFTKESSVAKVTVRIPDRELRALRLLTVSGPAAEYTPVLCSSASLGGMAFYTNEVQVINDYQAHQLNSEFVIAPGIKSELAVPIRSDSDRIMGSVAISSYVADYFSLGVVENFRGLARDLGNLMESTSLAEAEFLHTLSRVGIPGAEYLGAESLTAANR